MQAFGGATLVGVLVTVWLLSPIPVLAEDNLGLSRDGKYWLAPEKTPGAFLCQAPAATDVTVVCDRWPDGSDVRRFGLDAIRLCGATTDHEKCLAVYRWVRRWMIFPDKKMGPPTEKIVASHRKGGYVDQALKQLNVYGIHWCDGQTRVVEAIWRSLGYRAEKIVRGGHTVVGCHYRDYDDVERWHVLDVSHSAFAFDRSRRRLLGPDELSTRWYSFYYQWIFCPHNDWDDHRMELAFRVGEKLERIWGNWGKPYQDNVARGDAKVPQWERGPYQFDFGNGRWTYLPDLSNADWVKGLAQPPVNMAPDRLEPAQAGKPATATWHFRTPYIVSDAEVKMRLLRKSAQDAIRLHLSVDEGKTWKRLWECPADVVGRQQLTVPICDKFQVTGKAEPPQGFNSPFGRYAYRLKLELFAKDKPEDCQVEDISFETVVQQNFFSLPQLQPGRNRITVRGKLAQGAALKVTYLWKDLMGEKRKNVTVLENIPYTYEIITAGKRWEDVMCKSLVVEAVRATGEGNRTVVKEEPSEIHELSPTPPVEETVRAWKRPSPEEVPPVDEIIKNLERGSDLRRMVDCTIELGDPRAFDAVKKVVYECPERNVKNQALVALYLLDREKARPVLLDILNDESLLRVKWNTEGNYAGRRAWQEAAAVIGYMAAEAGWKEFLPGLLEALPGSSPGWGPRYGLVRVIGRLGRGNKDAARAVEKKEHGDAKAVAAEVAGLVGDPALIPVLRRYLDHGYEPLKHNAALSLAVLGDRGSAPRIRSWLTLAGDENYRGVAAEALGYLRDKDSLPALESALEVEPFPWVREKIEEALAKIQAP
jgi:HEAT repeat protein